MRRVAKIAWVSPELWITLLQVLHAPNGEDRTEQLDNITLREPDPSPFAPPPSCRVRMDDHPKRTGHDNSAFRPIKEEKQP